MTKRTRVIKVRINSFEEEILRQYMKMEGIRSFSIFFRKKAIENTYFNDEKLKQILRKLEHIEDKI